MPRPLPFLLVALVVGCGGSVSSGTTDASTDASLDTSTPIVCPPAPPRDGDPCGRDGLECSYGDDPRDRCNYDVTCLSGTWRGGGSGGGCAPLVPPGATCPPSLEAAASMSSPCSPDGMICTYGDRLCACSSCNGPCSTTAHFYCDTAPTDARCPSARPAIGSACSVEGARCTYGVCAGGTIGTRVCTGGVWTDEPTACPV